MMSSTTRSLLISLVLAALGTLSKRDVNEDSVIYDEEPLNETLSVSHGMFWRKIPYSTPSPASSMLRWAIYPTMEPSNLWFQANDGVSLRQKTSKLQILPLIGAEFADSTREEQLANEEQLIDEEKPIAGIGDSSHLDRSHNVMGALLQLFFDWLISSPSLSDSLPGDDTNFTDANTRHNVTSSIQAEHAEPISTSRRHNVTTVTEILHASNDISSVIEIETKVQKVKRLDSQYQLLVACCIPWILFLVAFSLWCKEIKLHLRYRELIPGLGKLLYKLGVDKHIEIECKLVLHEVSYTEQLKTYLMVRADHHENVSEASKMGPSQFQKGSISAGFHEAICIVVPQGCTAIEFKLLDMDKKTVLAEGAESVDKVMRSDDDDLEIVMLRRGKGKVLLSGDPRCRISCSCDDNSSDYEGHTGSDSELELEPPPEEVLLSGLDTNALPLELKLEIEKQSRNRVIECGIEGSKFSDKEMAEHQLEVIAKASQGKLVIASNSATKQYCFRVFREDDVNGSFFSGWKLGYWDRDNFFKSDKPSDLNKVPPRNTIPILSIGKIFPDPNKVDEFTVEYIEDSKPLSLRLIIVDRSRDLWVECLGVFINHLRKIRSEIKETGKNPKRASNIVKQQREPRDDSVEND